MHASCVCARTHRPYTFAKLAPVRNTSTDTQPVVLREEGLYNLNAVESMARFPLSMRLSFLYMWLLASGLCQSS